MTQNKIQRTPLGQRGKADVAQTLLRVVGKPAKTRTVDVLDVAAFQSFAD